MVKKGAFFAIGGIVLIVAILLVVYYSFLYFNKKQPDIDINTLEVVLSNQGKINLTEQSPIDDSQSSIVEPYQFTVKNNGKSSAKYELLIEDFVTDSTKKLLSRKYLNYELILNGDSIKKENLGNIKNNILDIRVLSENQENNYELIIWVTGDINSTEWMGKIYYYNVVVNPLTV